MFWFMFADRLLAGQNNEVTWHGLIPVEPVGRIDFLLFY
jgi:hypothetical protein